MERLIAKYQIELESPLLVKRSESDELRYDLVLDDAEVKLLLIPFEGHKGKNKHERIWSFEIRNLEISVSFPETEVPPPADITPKDDQGSYYEIEQYFKTRIPKYTDIAAKVFRRLIRFFKYKKGMPFLSEQGGSVERFPLPVWSDENGKEIWKSESRVFVVPYIPGFYEPEFGIKKFRKSDDVKLVKAIENDSRVALHEAILSDAQSAILRSDLRRGILEMAIACEVAVKQTFFAESTVSGSAYEYLENKGRVKVRVIELISRVAAYTFGESFKQANEVAYRDIDFLFRCRNRIAHRGEVAYRDDQGKWHQPDSQTLKGWWKSIEELLGWLAKRKPQK